MPGFGDMGERVELRNSLIGLVFDIQRFSIHDGPGIRTLVFMKGCPLACAWCSNPESQNPHRDIMFMPATCIGCGSCAEACPTGAAKLKTEFEARRLCRVCGTCVDTCPTNARKLIGRPMSVQEVLSEVDKDIPFYRQSEGGVTITGGEPLLQAEFVTELLRICRERGIHTAVETSGYTSWKTLQKVLTHLDLLLYDVKHMDDRQHMAFTGVGNELILDNLRRAADSGSRVIIRVAVVPGYNDSSDNLRATAAYARSLPGVEEIHMLPYHRLGEAKYERLGRAYALRGISALERDAMNEQARLMESYGLRVSIGG